VIFQTIETLPGKRGISTQALMKRNKKTGSRFGLRLLVKNTVLRTQLKCEEKNGRGSKEKERRAAHFAEGIPQNEVQT